MSKEHIVIWLLSLVTVGLGGYSFREPSASASGGRCYDLEDFACIQSQFTGPDCVDVAEQPLPEYWEYVTGIGDDIRIPGPIILGGIHFYTEDLNPRFIVYDGSDIISNGWHLLRPSKPIMVRGELRLASSLTVIVRYRPLDVAE